MKKKDVLLVGIAAGLATAAIFFFWKKNKDAEDKPPKKAPQVPLVNPGDQSEFTTSATESEVG